MSSTKTVRGLQLTRWAAHSIRVSTRSASVKANGLSALKSSNPQIAFPCLDKLEAKTMALTKKRKSENISSLETGPEPAYSKVQTGFKLFKSEETFFTDNGGILPRYEIAYETWGKLNESKNNLILLQTGLSASSHAKSQPDNLKPGWWENFIGSGKPLDTDKFFIVCTNALGGCYGSTGPSSIDPADNEVYGTRFPILTINDMVRAQRELVRNEFGVEKIYAAVGASMGGMQSLAYSWEFPDEVEKVISISGCARSHPYSIALRFTQRQVLMSDPNWNRGFYYNSIPPHIGMKLAREIATVTYRSGPEWEYRFGTNRADLTQPPALCPDFLVETYLDHQGEKFSLEYDANSFLYILKAMDLFNLSASNREKALRTRRETEAKYNSDQPVESSACLPKQPYEEKTQVRASADESLEDLRKGLAKIAHKNFLIIGVESDILFPVWQQREIADVLKSNGGERVEYFELDNSVSNYGHDTFLLSLDHLTPPITKFLN